MKTNFRPVVVLSDLDSTLANVHHREHLAPKSEAERDELKSWIPYSKGCVDDTVVSGVLRALLLHKRGGALIGYVSGRNEEAISETISWLEEVGAPVDLIRLHGENDPRDNADHKVASIKNLQALGYDVALMYEDHVSVCEIIERETGVPCVTVRPRYNDGVGVSFNLARAAATEEP